jgi:hypothetical protein
VNDFRGHSLQAALRPPGIGLPTSPTAAQLLIELATGTALIGVSITLGNLSIAGTETAALPFSNSMGLGAAAGRFSGEILCPTVHELEVDGNYRSKDASSSRATCLV